MIDSNQIYNYIKAQINPYGKPFEGTVFEFGIKIMDYINHMEKQNIPECSDCSRRKFYQIGYKDGIDTKEWISCNNEYPANEQVVEITYRYKKLNSNEYGYDTTRAFYHDGTMTTEDSDYCWYDTDNWEFDEEKDAYIIPEGWWEYNRFGETIYIVDQRVVAWKMLGDPYKEE